MTQIFDSLKALISTGMVSKAASLFGEDKANVSNGVSAIIPSLLGLITKKGHSPQIKNILEEAGNLDIASHVDKIFTSKPTHEQQNVGDDFLQHLLGDKAADFTEPIANASGMSKVATNGLISMIAPVVAGFLGKKLVSGMSATDLFGKLDEEKSSFMSLIPAGLSKTFGLTAHAAKPSTTAANTHTTATTASRPTPEPKKGGFGWLIWLIALGLLLFAIFYFWRSCNTPVEKIGNVVENVKDKTTEVVQDVKEKIATELRLPDGTVLNAFQGGIEEQMITFLNSDTYKNDTEEQLKDKWFNFDNIDFKFGSSTELTEESYPQLDNIARILTHYQGVKIKIGGYTDKTGDSAANQKLSEARANTIKAYLEKGGINAASITTEGFGDQFAKFPADAPDSDRVHDRKIALRFVK